MLLVSGDFTQTGQSFDDEKNVDIRRTLFHRTLHRAQQFDSVRALSSWRDGNRSKSTLKQLLQVRYDVDTSSLQCATIVDVVMEGWW